MNDRKKEIRAGDCMCVCVCVCVCVMTISIQTGKAYLI